MVVDFHAHWFPPAVVVGDPSGLMPALAAVWPQLLDLEAQLDAAAAAGTDVRVVNAVLSSIAPAARVPLAELPARVNDELAAAVAAHPGRLAALATVDAFAGDAGAEEARRAVEQLGLPGIVVDAAQGELLLGDPQARPTLDYAAGAGVPVFAHPVNPPELAPRYARLGGPGVLLARGTESALSTLGLLADGVLAERPGLDLVLAGIGGAALLLAQFLDPAESGPGAPSAARARLHIDTMGFDPKAVAFAVDVLGPEHVLVGSDWPIMRRAASRERVEHTLSAAGLGDADAALVAGANAVRLLGL